MNSVEELRRLASYVLVPSSNITIIIMVIRGVYLASVVVGTPKNIIIKTLRIDIIKIIRK